MNKIEQYKVNIIEHLRLFPISSMSLYVEGIGGVVLPRAGEQLVQTYPPSKILVQEVSAPEKSDVLSCIVEKRVPAEKVRVNNFLPGLRSFSVDEHVTLSLFRMDYRHWRGTLPQGDEYDSLLTLEGLHTPFSTASVVVSKDDYIITPQRVLNRASHQGDLCLINGCGRDRDDTIANQKSFSEKITDGTGKGLAAQNKLCVAAQLHIPLESILSTDFLGLVSSEPSFADNGSGDYGFHAAYLTRVDLTAVEIVDAANELYGDISLTDKGRYVKLTSQHCHPVDESYLKWFVEYSYEQLAVTMQPVFWLGCGSLFGETFVRTINFVEVNDGAG